MRHFCSLKSSTSEFGITAFAFALVFETFALAFVLALTLLLRFSLRVLALRLLVLAFEPRLARAMTITTRPTPMTSSAASPPSIHQTAFDFLRTGGGAPVGGGVHCGAGGGGGGGGVVGLGVTTGCCCGR